MWTEEVVGHIYNVLKGQVLSPVKVCEESEVTTNIQLYEIKQMSFTIKLYLKNVTALTNTFYLNGAFVYRLGHKIFILGRGVRLPYALPNHRRFVACIKMYDVRPL